MRWDEYMAARGRAQIIVLGPGRSGKTVLTYSATQLGKTLSLEAEDGAHSAKNFILGGNLEIEPLAKHVKDPKTGKQVPLPREKQPPIAERLNEFRIKAFSGKYDFVIVDSITDVCGRFEDEYARVGTPKQNDWYKIIEGVKSFVRDLKNGSFHLIVTCIAAGPKEGSLIEISPALPGQLRETLAPMFQSIVLCRYDKKDKRRKLVVNDPSLGVLDRFHPFGTAREVDVEGRPAEVLKKMVQAAQGMNEDGEAEETEVQEEEKELTQAPVVRKAIKVIRPVVGR